MKQGDGRGAQVVRLLSLLRDLEARRHPIELELHAPIEPEGEPRLQARATFQMPQIPTRH